jgi:2-methylcitrate dehydratase PrpD
MVKRATEFIRELSFSHLDEATVQSAKDCLLDFIGAALGGAGTKAGEISLKIGKTLGEAGRATLWNTGEKISCQGAAFIHGTMGSALDIDDGHRMAVGHPGGVVIPAAVAIAEETQSSGRDLIEAIVCGYEVAIRSGNMHRLESSRFAAVAGSGRWGSIGAAASASKLLRLGPEQTEQALAISAAFTPVAPVIDDLKRGFMPMTKFCSGWAGMVGICGALLAKEGFTGISSTIDFSWSELPDFGESYEIKNTYFKPYPSCRWTHPALEGMMDLMKTHPDLGKDTIHKISVKIFSHGSHLGWKQPQTMESAQYSIPFLIGAVITDGVLTPEQLTEDRLKDPEILHVADRVQVLHSPELDQDFPKAIPSEIEIETISGRCYKTKVTTPKGDPKNPMGTEEFTDKFRKLAIRSVSLRAAERLIEDIKRLDQLATITGLFEHS